MRALASEEPQVDPAPIGPHAPSAASVRNVSKTFRLPHRQYHTLKERAVHPFRSRGFDVLRAVQDVSVEIPRGEFFGIVGRNGSGKSTLLKCLAGIYEVDQGEIEIEGRLSPFIELGVGFNPDLTARDNVIINAIMLGLSRREARARFDDILAFAELQQFVDLKLKNYSSGMYVRLAFATAVQVDADILLIDEVLAVGDAAFQQKCFDEFTRLREANRTILFVTHDMGAVERYCDRAMLLERGRVVDIGDPSSIARQYNRINFQRLSAAHGDEDFELTPEVPAAEVVRAHFETRSGEIAVTALQGEECEVLMEVVFHEPAENPIFAIALMSEAGHTAFAANTDQNRIASGSYDAEAVAKIRLRFQNWLAPGRYRLYARVVRNGPGADVLGEHAASTLMVLPDRPAGGMTDLPHSFELS